jgi:hypothetical protein
MSIMARQDTVSYRILGYDHRPQQNLHLVLQHDGHRMSHIWNTQTMSRYAADSNGEKLQ